MSNSAVRQSLNEGGQIPAAWELGPVEGPKGRADWFYADPDTIVADLLGRIIALEAEVARLAERDAGEAQK